MATIYCFTSTGNSLYAAKAIADKIGAKVLPMRDEHSVCEDDVIGFVYPCYFWAPPRMVERFVAKMQITKKDAYVFAVMTCGGPVTGALGILKKLLLAKGVRLSYGKHSVTVTNYLPDYKAKDSEALRQKVAAKIEEIAGDIIDRKENSVAAPSFLNNMIYKHFPGEDSDKYFSVSQACNGCMTCQKVCHADNIAYEDNRPVFLHKCEHCLACLQNCPAYAIDWKGKTQGKERYRNANVSLEDLIDFKLAVSDITAANGGSITVTIANPTGFTLSPTSRSVAVFVAKSVDINGDGKVDATDLSLLISDFGNKYDARDLAELLSNFGK